MAALDCGTYSRYDWVISDRNRSAPSGDINIDADRNVRRNGADRMDECWQFRSLDSNADPILVRIGLDRASDDYEAGKRPVWRKPSPKGSWTSQSSEKVRGKFMRQESERRLGGGA